MSNADVKKKMHYYMKTEPAAFLKEMAALNDVLSAVFHDVFKVQIVKLELVLRNYDPETLFHKLYPRSCKLENRTRHRNRASLH